MADLAFRPAPALVPRNRFGQRASDFFAAWFPMRSEIRADHGQVVSFDATNVWTFQKFFIPVERCEYLSWLKDTLTNPDEILKVAGTVTKPDPTERFVSFYSTERSKYVYVVRCSILVPEPEVRVKPYLSDLVPESEIEDWLERHSDAERVWCRDEEEAEPAAAHKDDAISIAEIFGPDDILLIVGARTTNLPDWIWRRREVVVWSSTEMGAANPEVPERTRFILVTKWVSHARSEPIERWAKKREVPFRKATTGQIRKYCRGWQPGKTVEARSSVP